MSLIDFFSPVPVDSFVPEQGYINSQLGLKVDFYVDKFPDLDSGQYDLAIIGVEDERGVYKNEGCALTPQQFRKHFYQLNEGAFQSKIIDLGNIKAGAELSDTYFALRKSVEALIKANILPIIIGGSQDLTYAQYLAYEHVEQKVDLVVIDNQFDIEEDVYDHAASSSRSYMHKILLHEPNYLFNFSNIGYQTFFVNQESLSVMDKLYFDAHRLGVFKQDITLAEPILRNANMISFDAGAIRASDALGNALATPNGFDGIEACAIARYAGMNDKLTSIGFYEFNAALDTHGHTMQLLAQMIWYFVEGYYNRKQDFPLTPVSQYIIYRTSLKDGSGEMTFVKSKKSDRWWMQVPYPTGQSKNERYHLVPCKYDDYQMAVDGEMPDLWWRTFQKLT